MSAPSFSESEKGSAHCMKQTKRNGLRQPAVTLSSEQYERLFFQPGPPNPPVDLSRQFGNPTPLGVVSFLMSLTPTSCFFLTFDHTNRSSPIALSGVYFLMGGLGLFTAGLLEWVLGNTFPFMIFCTFGAYWLNFGFLNDPAQGIAQAFEGGTSAASYNTGLMFYWIFWVVLLSIYWTAAWRVNVVFVYVLTCLWMKFAFNIPVSVALVLTVAASFNQLGHGELARGAFLLKVAGGFGLAAACGGWYFAFGHMMAAVRMPFIVPFGDLSARVLIGRRGDVESNGTKSE